MRWILVTSALVSACSEAATPRATADAEVEAPAARPPLPSSLVRHLVGDDADRDVTPTGPGFILMGGGTDVDDAFVWWKKHLAGGDVVVLRRDDRSGYGPYLYSDIGGCDSVETLVVTTKQLANDPYVAWTVAHAEGIFLAGGDQAEYLRAWRGTALATALATASKRGAILGGTSAGCAVLPDVAYAAYATGTTSSEALSDPYHPNVTLEPDFLSFAPLAGIITDTHFAERDRMGRLAAFVARIQQDGLASEARGLGVDEETALVVGPDGSGTVVGVGRVYAVRARSITRCAAGAALDATFDVHRLAAGDAIALPSFTTSRAPVVLSARDGALTTDPY